VTRAPVRAIAVAAIGCTVAVSFAISAGMRGRHAGGEPIDRGERAQCGAGFAAVGARCLVAREGACPRPLVPTSRGCDAPDERVAVPETTLEIGPSDWEAEGMVGSRTIHVSAFRIDAFEVTEGRYAGAEGAADPGRAARGMARADAEAFCEQRGGRLPTEDEWIVAAASGGRGSAPTARRYPWGETGAVCRRAAWGLLKGPCARGADGPDTVGSHPDGDSPSGVHDLAGNVAEWVGGEGRAGAPAAPAIAKGGSWASSLATELRTWARLELPAREGDARVGFRCAYSL
jgi:formylglycine-generating enzyme required for sulfatase activity